MSAEDEPINLAAVRQRIRNTRSVKGSAEQRPKNIAPHVLAAAERARRLRSELCGLVPEQLEQRQESVRDPNHPIRILAGRLARRVLNALRIQ